MSLVRLQNVAKRYGDQLILRDVDLRLDAGQRVGLIGKNGSGKTTLLRLIVETEQPTEGLVSLEAGVRIGYFSQFSELDGTSTVRQALAEVFADIGAIERELAAIAAELSAVGTSPERLQTLIARQELLFAEMQRRDGWSYPVRIDTALSRLGFGEPLGEQLIDQLSSGWRNRAALAKILLQRPDVLLLDEPTNYLDVGGLEWLEEWLMGFGGAALVVTHDRDFLDRVATEIIEIENYHFQRYTGGFADYVREKRANFASLQRQFVHEEALLAFEAEAIEDRAAMRANPSKALRRKLATIKRDVEPPLVDRILTGIYQQLRVPADLLTVERLAKGYDGQRLFHDLTFSLHRGDRLAVVGPNGCGKSTLLGVIAERLLPDEGQVRWTKGGAGVDFADVWASQDLSATASHAVNVTGIAYHAPRRQVNEFLGLLRLSEQDLRRPIGELSGGLRARVTLAQCLLSGANVLLLDEPTNHLDLTSTQVMERALACFPGAVVVISHDRYFIDKIATRLLVFTGPDEVTLVNGSWSQWQARLAATKGGAR